MEGEGLASPGALMPRLIVRSAISCPSALTLHADLRASWSASKSADLQAWIRVRPQVNSRRRREADWTRTLDVSISFASTCRRVVGALVCAASCRQRPRR